MSESYEDRIAREEAYWTAPRLFVFGLGFLACAIGFIYAMSQIAQM